MQEKNHVIRYCILSGLPIPAGKLSRDHYYPRSKLPHKIAMRGDNIYSAHTLLNTIKRDLLPCQWYDMRWELTYRAIETWNISADDRQFLRDAMKNWLVWKYNPCDYCIALRYHKYCLQR